MVKHMVLRYALAFALGVAGPASPQPQQSPAPPQTATPGGALASVAPAATSTPGAPPAPATTPNIPPVVMTPTPAPPGAQPPPAGAPLSLEPSSLSIAAGQTGVLEVRVNQP